MRPSFQSSRLGIIGGLLCASVVGACGSEGSPGDDAGGAGKPALLGGAGTSAGASSSAGASAGAAAGGTGADPPGTSAGAHSGGSGGASAGVEGKTASGGLAGKTAGASGGMAGHSTGGAGGAAAGSTSGGSGGCLDGPGVTTPPGYKLVWSDEFDVDGAPNRTFWGYETGFVRNEEAQWYQPDNARVDKGCLVIEGRKERKANPNYQSGSSDWKRSRQYAEYTSSSLSTSGKQTWQFGRFEMRGRIKTESGLWPAWWTLGTSGEWPSCGEVDIMEYYAGNVRANVACGTSERWEANWDSEALQVATFEDKDWQSKFHTWRMDWDDDQISLYLDDKLVNDSRLADMLNADGKSPFRQHHYMIVNLALGGNNGGDLSKTAFPSRFEVDYIRVFQKD